MHRFVIAVGAVLLLAGVAQAQPSNFGTIQLQAGFMPDPRQTGGTSGGANQAQQMNGSCRGWISATPDHILVLSTPFRFLRVFAESQSDTTLVIQSMSNGQTWCADDTYGTNPGVEGAFAAGTYRVWIGSYRQGENARYTLKLTELNSVVPGGAAATAQGGVPTTQGGVGVGVGGGATGVIPGTGMLDLVGRRGNFRAVRLRTGFRRDPTTQRGQSGGRFNAQTLGPQCRGWVAQRPDHIFTAQSSFNFLRIYARANADTTLAVLTPTGRWLCNDDANNSTNPAIDISGAAPGVYRIWVGSYQSGVIAPYTIGFTEFNTTF
jgi:hypothetical protein